MPTPMVGIVGTSPPAAAAASSNAAQRRRNARTNGHRKVSRRQPSRLGGGATQSRIHIGSGLASPLSCGPSSVTTKEVEGESKLVACAVSIVRIYRSYGYSGGDITKDALKYGRLWIGWCGDSGLSWVGLMKYKLAAFYAAHLNQELPPRPAGIPVSDRPDVILGGRYFRWARMFLRTTTKVNRHSFLMSVKFSKNDMPRPGWYECCTAAIEGFQKLTTERAVPPGRFLLPWADFPADPVRFETFLSRESMTREIRRTVREIFSRRLGEYKGENTYAAFCELETPKVPSTSACYELGRAKGGTAAYLHEVHELQSSIFLDAGDDLGKTPRFELPCSRGFRFLNQGLHEDDERQQDNWYGPILDPSGTELNAADFHRQVTADALEILRERQNLVRIAPLAEALKVRNITAGRAAVQYSLHLLQKFLWRRLRSDSSRVFTLVGQSIDEEYVTSILGRRPLSPNERIISVDYSDCTNNLTPWASEAVCAELHHLGVIDSEIYELLVSGLTGHIIRNPLDSNDFKEQQHGQLMGSIVSFPVLCIINAAVLRWVSELSRLRVLTLRDAHCAVNGDDGIIRGTDRSMEYLSRAAAFVGLPLSVGKVYESREFFDMNSRVFLVHPDPRTGKNVFTEVPFVQQRMLSGLTRSGVPPGPVWKNGSASTRRDDRADTGERDFLLARALGLNPRARDLLRKGYTPSMGLLRELAGADERLRLVSQLKSLVGMERVSPASVLFGDGEKSWPAGRTIAEFLNTCPVHLRSTCYASFLARSKSSLPSGIPWYLPLELGGLGFPILYRDGRVGWHSDDGPDTTSDPSDWDVTFGPSELDLKVATCIRNKLLSGEMSAFDYSARPEWLLRKVASTYLPWKSRFVISPTRAEIELTRRVNGILALEAYLTSPIDRIFHPSDADEAVHSRITTARNAWRLRNYTSLPSHGLNLETVFRRNALVEITPIAELSFY